MADTIDGLQIEIESDATNATNGLDNLAKSLRSLKSAVSAGNDTAKNLRKISSALKSLGQVDLSFSANLKSVTESLSEIKRVSASLNKVDFKQFTSNMNSLSTALSPLDGFKTQSYSLINSISNIGSAQSVLSGADFDVFKEKVGQMREALSDLNKEGGSLSAIGKSGISSTINAIAKIPDINKSLNSEEIDKFAASVRRLTEVLNPLATEMESVSRGFSMLPSRIQSAIRANEKLTSSNGRASGSYKSYANSIARTITKMTVLGFAMRRVVDLFSDMFEESNNYIENMNLFTVTMGDSTESALEFANTVSKSMGIDVSQWIENQGAFMQMATGFGIASDQAQLMSQNLTQLAYDIASFHNVKVETAMDKLKSGMSGQIKGLKEFGYNLSVAALQETALSLGIEQSVRTMTEAQRAQLRYITLMRVTTNAQGDMARTLLTPANSLRILQSQFVQLKRAIGDVISVVVVKLIPYVMAFVEIVTDAARALASLFGFELPTIDYSGLELGSDVVDDIDDGLNDATDSAKKLNAQLMGFDELNVLKSNDSGSGGASYGTSHDLGVELPEYDFLENLDTELSEKVDKIKEKIKNILPIVTDIGAGLLAWSISTNIFRKLEDMKKLIKGIPGDIASAFSLRGLGFTMFFSDLEEFKRYFEDFLNNGATLSNVSGMLSEFVGAIGDVFIFFGRIKVGGAIKVVQGIGEIVSGISDIAKNGMNIDNALTVIRGLTNIAIGISVFTGNIKAAAWSVSIQGMTAVIREIYENWEAIKEGDWSGVDKVSLAIGAIEALGGVAVALGAFSKIKKASKTASAASDAASAIGQSIESAGSSFGSVGQSVGGASTQLTSVAKNLGVGVGIIAEVAAAAIIFAGAIAVLGYELQKVSDAWGPVIENGETVATAIGLGTVIMASVGGVAYGLGTIGKTAATNIGIGTAILLEIGLAAGLFITEIGLIGDDLNKVGEAWGPVIDDGKTVLSGIALGTATLVGIGTVAALLGVATTASGYTLPIAIGIGTAMLAELGLAAGLFISEIANIGNGLNEVGTAWQPVLDNGWTVMEGIVTGTALLVGIGTVAAALGAVTIASGLLLPAAIAAGALLLSELSDAVVDFTGGIVDVADELSDSLAPALDKLNSKLPGLESNMSDFTDYMTDFADEITSYTDSMGSVTWSSIVSGFTKLFAKNPIKDFADSVSDTEADVTVLNDNLKSANEDLNTAITLLSDYKALLSAIEALTSSGEIKISSDLFVNFKAAGKSLVTGLAAGVTEYSYAATNSMNELGKNMMLSLKSSIDSNKSVVRTSLSEIFSGVKIKLPKFSFTGKFDAEKMTVPKLKVAWSYYADGGFPVNGDMFIARESGPEMVGRIGSKTSVANNDQIVQGISAGVADANQELISVAYAVATQIVTAIRENGGDVYLDGDKVSAKVTSSQKQNDRMYG